MRELGRQTKIKVIKLFFEGYSYNDIVRQTGVSKGSVVNIIDAFRDGALEIPPGMAEHMVVLRQVAVDSRKDGISVSEAAACIGLHRTLDEMGATPKEAGVWLATVQEIAGSSGVSDGELAKHALELRPFAIATRSACLTLQSVPQLAWTPNTVRVKPGSAATPTAS